MSEIQGAEISEKVSQVKGAEISEYECGDGGDSSENAGYAGVMIVRMIVKVMNMRLMVMILCQLTSSLRRWK